MSSLIDEPAASQGCAGRDPQAGAARAGGAMNWAALSIVVSLIALGISTMPGWITSSPPLLGVA